MKMKLEREEQILDPGFRKAVLDEIVATENVRRKRHELRKYEIYRDMTRKWVVQSLLDEGLKHETVRRMEQRASNLSVCKKIVNKKAQSYTHGVIRTVEDEPSQEAIDLLTKELDFNSLMKKTDRYIELFKNTVTGIIPEKDFRESEEMDPRFKLTMKVIPPYLYDAIEDKNDNTQLRVLILTDFIERNQFERIGITTNTDGRGLLGLQHGHQHMNMEKGNRKDEIIADHPSDQGTDFRTFIWWSDTYHFTTDDAGVIIPGLSPEDNLNPIEILPYVNHSDDQDCEFWAQGGDDLIEGSVLINKLITDMYSIANYQGWGQLVIAGKGVAEKKWEIGPHNALLFDVDADDPAPTVQFATANPPLDVWMQMIEQYVALLLSTNNLTPRAVAGKLDVSSMASGIAMLIEKAESTADQEDRQKEFKDNEPVLWEIIRRWQDLLFDRGALNEAFNEIGPFEDSDVQLEFVSAPEIASEKEKLEEIKVRKDLGINSEIELLQIDNPDLSEEEAEKKLLQIKEEKLKRMELVTAQMQSKENDEEDIVGEEEDTQEDLKSSEFKRCPEGQRFDPRSGRCVEIKRQ